jgi:hypothetical protein
MEEEFAGVVGINIALWLLLLLWIMVPPGVRRASLPISPGNTPHRFPPAWASRVHHRLLNPRLAACLLCRPLGTHPPTAQPLHPLT